MKYFVLIFMSILYLYAEISSIPLVYKELSKEVFDTYNGTKYMLRMKFFVSNTKELTLIQKKSVETLAFGLEVDEEFIPKIYKEKSNLYLEMSRELEPTLRLYDTLLIKYMTKAINQDKENIFNNLVPYSKRSLTKDMDFQKKVLAYYKKMPKNSAVLNALASNVGVINIYNQTRYTSQNKSATSIDKPLAINRHTQTFSELELLISRMQSQGKLPQQMAFIDTYRRDREVRLKNFKSSNLRKRGTSHQNLKCFENNKLDGLIGNELNNVIYCSEENKWILAGKGDDEINMYAKGVHIISPGLGNDRIMSVSGSIVLIMNQDWGHDEISLSTVSSDFLPDTWRNKSVSRQSMQTTLRDYAIKRPQGWKYRYTNFIVFGRGISPYDLEITEDRITNIKTGDTIDFEYRPCFNLVFEDSDITESMY